MKLRHFNIMRLLYCLVLALPFVAILSRVIYVQNNKNAYQSAEITQTIIKEVNPIYEYETNRPNNIDELILGNAYSFEDATYTNNSILTSNNNAYLHFKIIQGQIEFTNLSYDDVDFDDLIVDNEVEIKFDSDNNIIFYVGDINLFGAQDDEIEFTTTNLNFELMDFENVDYQIFLPATNLILSEYELITEDATTLDNVFEYSVNKFIDDNNFGRLNLFQWTTNLFFDDNQVNNMYVHFVNWYLNYVLLMSTTYILFLVLMWFVNYSRRLLERGMNYDW